MPAAQGSAVEKADDTSASEHSPGDVVGRNVTTDSLAYGEVGEQLVYGHFAFPEDMVDPLPAILVIHDRWGLNREIVEFGSRLASEGYIVLAIDLFGGSTASEPSAARDLELRVVEEPDLALANVRQAYRFVSDVAGAPSVGVLGFGFGGGWALNAAIAQPYDFAAIVSYYGQVNSDQDLLAPVAGPILGLFAEDDRAVPVDSVRAFERELEALDKDFEIVVYDDARRGFADTLMDDAYDQDIAARAWQQTLEFLRAGFSRPAM
ncbi:MAG: dienelactone hydrolase family protein [Gammaproteobacteria bacterium]|nr:dienelactone hydrolase family protein [Gammaproteobacteria bacterium]